MASAPRSSCLRMIGAAVALVAATARGETVFVDDDAPPGGDGSSWATAHRHLQDALATASGGTTICVASGVYRPDRDAARPDGDGDRTRAFVLVEGTALLGGFAGTGGPSPGVRDPARFVSVLSGDLAGDDGPEFAGTGENSHHVVTTEATSGATRLDGLVIRGGDADGADDDAGGAVLCVRASVTIVDCVIEASRASRGGGVAVRGGAPVLERVVFGGNEALAGGAIIVEQGGTPVIDACSFTGNAAILGGAVAVLESIPEITNGTFLRNTAMQGGALYNVAASAFVLDCVLVGNSAGYAGGAMHNVFGTPTLKRCRIVDNTAGVFGGAVSSTSNAMTTVKSCTLRYDRVVGGAAGAGGALYAEPDSLSCVSDSSFCGSVPEDIAGPWTDQGANDFAASCPCPEDLDGSETVEVGDVLVVLRAWGTCDACPADLDGSGAVDLADVTAVLAAWGACP